MRAPVKTKKTTQPSEPQLIAAAQAAREQALATYSGFKVGAALLTTDGKMYTGCNIETVTFRSICAERVALFKALSEGNREFAAAAVVTDAVRLTPPCGTCRQLLWEFCGDIRVTLANLSGDQVTYQLSALLPMPFDKSWLAPSNEK